MNSPPLDGWQTFVTIVALAAGIMLTRFVPFLLFVRRERLPRAIVFLGGTLPHAAMALLLVYCLKDVSPFHSPYGLPEALALLFTGALHLWKNNVLASIAGGTLFYMALVQYVL